MAATFRSVAFLVAARLRRAIARSNLRTEYWQTDRAVIRLDVLLLLLLLPFLLPLLSLLVLWVTRVRYHVLEGQYRREGRVF